MLYVHDGDTFTILEEPDGGKFKVKLRGIDAPERGQKNGPEAWRMLTTLLISNPLTVKFTEIDDTGCIIGTVLLGDQHDIGLWMLMSGYAWHDYRHDDNLSYIKAEKDSRNERCGLWSDLAPVPPWAYREQLLLDAE